MNEAIDRFLSGETFAVAGASVDQAKYGNKVFRRLIAANKSTVPLNPNAESVEGVAAFASLADVPKEIDSLSVVTPPVITGRIVDEAIEKGVKNIWMQPGAENPAASQKAREAGINVIDDGACILVALAR